MLNEQFYRPLGRSGLKVSPICLGGDNFVNPTPEKESLEILNCAVTNGINLIDTANSYADGRSEEIIGKFMQESDCRDDVILTTKFYYATGNKSINDKGTSRKHIIRACEDSLKRLKTDYIDIYQIHRLSMNTPLEETLGALTDLQQQGKIRYAGSTTTPSWKITEASMLADYKGLIRIVSEQLPYNLLDRRVENEILPAADAAGLAVIAWAALAMGLLTGRYDSANPDSFNTPRFNRGGIYAERITQKAADAGQAFVAIARTYELEPAHLALLWVKDQPHVTTSLCGPRTLAQLQDVLPVMEMSLTDEMRQSCDELVPPGSAIANFLNSAPWMKGKLL